MNIYIYIKILNIKRYLYKNLNKSTKSTIKILIEKNITFYTNYIKTPIIQFSYY